MTGRSSGEGPVMASTSVPPREEQLVHVARATIDFLHRHGCGEASVAVERLLDHYHRTTRDDRLTGEVQP